MNIINIDDGVEDGNWMFRIDQTNTTGGIQLYCYPFRIISKTPKGRWIVPSWVYHVDDIKTYRKFVLDGIGKRYAHITRDEALKAFIYRRKRQIEILRAQLNKAELAYKTAGGQWPIPIKSYIYYDDY